MNAFQKRNFKLDDPIEQGISCYKQDETNKGQYEGEPTTALERQDHIILIKLLFSKWYISGDVFSRSTKNGPFVRFQSITNDVLANNTCHQLGAYVTPGTHLLEKV